MILFKKRFVRIDKTDLIATWSLLSGMRESWEDFLLVKMKYRLLQHMQPVIFLKWYISSTIYVSNYIGFSGKTGTVCKYRWLGNPHQNSWIWWEILFLGVPPNSTFSCLWKIRQRKFAFLAFDLALIFVIKIVAVKYVRNGTITVKVRVWHIFSQLGSRSFNINLLQPFPSFSKDTRDFTQIL